MQTPKDFNRVGVIGRFKPLHNGAAAMLEAVCGNAKEVIIGIGSINKYNARNPFTAKETKGMIEAYLSSLNLNNYEIVHIPDSGQIPKYADGKKWKEVVTKRFGNLDYFVTSNPYVKELLGDTYKIIHPGDFISRYKWVPIRATQVRVEIARGGDWKKLVPEKVAEYLEKNNLLERFRKEFGLETLALLANYNLNETREEEKARVQED